MAGKNSRTCTFAQNTIYNRNELLKHPVPMSSSLGFRLAPFHHVHLLSETINRVKQVT